jgi:hypothetical protein
VSVYNESFFKSNPLFKECIDALREVTILPMPESVEMSNTFEKSFPITEMGKIDWKRIENKIEVGYDPNDILPALEKLFGKPVDTKVYIEWSTMGIPVIQTDLKRIIDVFDYVTCVSHEKFIFNLEIGYILEILVSDKMTIGVVPRLAVNS